MGKRKLLIIPGVRFKPTDIELVMFHLKNKLSGKKLDPEIIAEVNINELKPSDLPAKSIFSGDREWYFFYRPTSKRYKSGPRTKRATKYGYWKGTGEYTKVIYKGRTVAMRKTLIFYESHEGKGTRTDWVMHEYRMTDDDLSKQVVAQDAYVVCRVFEKSGLGPKNGAQYGAPFEEKDWDGDDDDDDDDESAMTSIMVVGVLVNTKNVSGSSVLVNTKSVSGLSMMNITSTGAGPSTVTSLTVVGLSGATQMLDPHASTSGPSTLVSWENERLTNVPVNNNTQEVENRKRKKVEVEDRKGEKVMTDPVNEYDVSINDDVMLTNPINDNITSTEIGPSTVTPSAVVGLSRATKRLDPNASTSGPSTLIYSENQRLIDVLPDHDNVMLSHGERALLLRNDNTQELEDSECTKVMMDDDIDISKELEAANDNLFDIFSVDDSLDEFPVEELLKYLND